LLYSVRNKLKAEYLGLSGNEIKDLKQSGVEVKHLPNIFESFFMRTISSMCILGVFLSLPGGQSDLISNI
jgi:hypothetical protein